MEIVHRASLLFVCVCLLLGCGNGSPTPRDGVGRIQNLLQQSFFDSFGEFAEFLRSYFNAQLERGGESGDSSPGGEQAVHVVRKRHATLPLQFEEVERQYLIKQSVQLLKQFVGYVEYVQKDDDTRSYLEEMLREHGDMMNTMSVAQLKSYLGTLQRTMEEGVNSQHQMVVNGKVFSLDHISSWCCQFG
ncbi:uncharacterized protein [Argopecten irradians]|uniref:uncharacterized protein n=1 Tax=Argopecten irradians TaxID=31199 RepID=UPI003710F19F